MPVPLSIPVLSGSYEFGSRPSAGTYTYCQVSGHVVPDKLSSPAHAFRAFIPLFSPYITVRDHTCMACKENGDRTVVLAKCQSTLSGNANGRCKILLTQASMRYI
jgi:hypothetical protein